jgi:hypothetical protein
MSKCEKIQKIVDSYKLELSQEELDTLYLITRLIGGDPEYSNRKYMDSIKKKIENHISEELKHETYRGVHLKKYFKNELNIGIMFFNKIEE